jgi:hypothetical protein
VDVVSGRIWAVVGVKMSDVGFDGNGAGGGPISVVDGIGLIFRVAKERPGVATRWDSGGRMMTRFANEKLALERVNSPVMHRAVSA